MPQYIYGRNSVLQRIKASKEIDVLYVDYEVLKKDSILKEKKEELNIKVKERGFLDSLVKNKPHQGYVAKIKDYKYYNVEEVLEVIKEKENQTILLLDNISDPHNFGAILRSCEASGVDLVICGKNSSAPLNATVSKTSAGAIENVKVASVNNLLKTLLDLKEKGFEVFSGEYRSESVDYRAVNFPKKSILIMGSEGKGISRMLIKNSDKLIKIPMVGKINSLNVSVACAIILYKIFDDNNPL